MLPVSSSTTPEELERMLFPINPELAGYVAGNLDERDTALADLEALEKDRDACHDRAAALRQALQDARSALGGALAAYDSQTDVYALWATVRAVEIALHDALEADAD